MSGRGAMVFAVALGAAACGGGEGAGGQGAAATRDSAGIAIVENSGGAWAADSGWTVDSVPTLSIGGRVGEPAYEFSQPGGPVLLPGRRLAVSNPVGGDIRIFDSAGSHLKTVGQKGGGPGEYQSIAALWTGPGDSILVADMIANRLSILDAEGTYVRSFGLGGKEGFAVPTNGRMSLSIPLAWFRDGSILAMSQAFRVNDPKEGTYRDTTVFMRYRSDGAPSDTIGSFPGIEMQQMQLTIGTQTINTPNPVPLGRTTTSAVYGDRVFIAKNDAWEIEVHGPDGALKAIYRVASTPMPISEADAAVARAEMLKTIEGAPQVRGLPEPLKKQILSNYQNVKFPATYPFIQGLLTDSDGNLWAQESVPGSPDLRRYAVLDPSGRLLGRVTLPPKFRAATITGGVIYGVWTDTDDVEHIRAYTLKKG
ncbi:MAG: hypothetical protein HOP28_11300 [Gemmatimonadales bacterium]|nr:hypothetical protein [Gemmatimonadales bacterium]